MSSLSFAVVTGASSGIGAALCRHLLTTGWKVCMIARSTQKMKQIVSEFPSKSADALVVTCDLSNTQQTIAICPRIIEWCDNNLTLLVNNAGGGFINHTTETSSVESFERHIRLNLTQVFILTKYLSPALKNHSKNQRHASFDSSIVNISSIGAQGTFAFSLTPYCVAKAGLCHLTRLNCVEFAPFKVRVNCINPATVATNAHNASGMAPEIVEEYYTHGAIAQHPIGRIGKPADIVSMIMFLANVDKAGWITGQVITLDGGRMVAGTQISHIFEEQPAIPEAESSNNNDQKSKL